MLTLSDLDERRRALADELSAVWLPAEEILQAPADIVVPAGIGGVLTNETISQSDTRAVVGPANNQLATEGLDDLLHRRGILWAPDFIVHAGGALATILTEVEGLTASEMWRRVDGIGGVLDTAVERAVTPLHAAMMLAEERLRGASLSRIEGPVATYGE